MEIKINDKMMMLYQFLGGATLFYFAIEGGAVAQRVIDLLTTIVVGPFLLYSIPFVIYHRVKRK